MAARRPAGPGRRLLVWYLLLALLSSTVLRVAAALLTGGAETAAGLVLLYAAGLAPLVFAVAFLFLYHDREYRRRYWRRLLDPRGNGYMLVLALLIPAAVTVFSVGLTSAFGGPCLRCALGEAPAGLSLAGLVVFSLFFGPVPEEMAWRGYAMPGVLEQMPGPGSASLAFGLYWAVWHVPLFFVPGTHQYDLGLGTLEGALFFTSIVATSFLYTWILTRGAGSTMACIFFHWSVNLSGELLQPAPAADTVRTAIWVLLAALLWWTWRREDRSASGGQRQPGSVAGSFQEP
jgi:membrane protease YdiL (CAAX protease family)